MVTLTNIRTMKSLIKHIALVVFALALFFACKRFDPEEKMIKTLNLPQCLKPVSVKTEVENNQVTFDLKVFPDVEKYVLELYDGVIYEDAEPASESLIERISIDPKDIPYTLTTLEDVTLYYRISATNEAEGKAASLWTIGHFKTSVDPAHVCVTPEPEVTASNDLIRFMWQKVLTDKYLLEVYNNKIPSSGDPEATDLFRSIPLTNDDLPYSAIFPPKEGSYYFRVKAMDLAGERKDSKWATGSFTSTAYVWPSETDAFDYGLAPGSSKTASFEGLGVEVDAKIPAPGKTVDGITWMSAEANSGTFKGDRVTYNRRKTYEKLEDNTTNVAADIGIRLKVNRPGTLKLFPKFPSNKTWSGNEQQFIAVLSGTKSGVFAASTIYSVTPTEDHVSKSSADKDDDKYCVIVEVTKEMLYGMDGPATIYLWHNANNATNAGIQFDYYPPKWTSAADE